MLRKKLFRDMRQNAMQFVALIALCMLGVFLFCGIDSFARITQASNDAFFSQNRLAHFFISLPSADRSAWDALRKGEFTPTMLYLRAPAPQTFQKLETMDEVEDIDALADQREEAFLYLNSVSTVFSILTFIALALAFVICYNMGLINFTERTREYATLKVLGYHQKEIRRLILSENLLITILAIAVSLAPGVGFTQMILSLVESESMRYAVLVTPRSIALASAITFGFSIFIQLLLTSKVRSIDMVEALKSVE